MKMNKQEKKILKDITIGTENEIVKNRFFGTEVELSPEAVAIYDIIMGAEAILHNDPDNKTIYDIFYTAKNVFIKNWPVAYHKLLD